MNFQVVGYYTHGEVRYLYLLLLYYFIKYS